MALQLLRRRRRRGHGSVGTMYVLLGVLSLLIIESLSVGWQEPDPPAMVLVQQPPLVAVVSKLQPLLLPCSAKCTGLDYDVSLNNDDSKSPDNADYEINDKIDFGEDQNGNIMDYHYVDDETMSTVKRHTAKRKKPIVLYKWYRNDQPIPKTANEFQVFPNGTLKIAYSRMASAVYHCVVDGMQYELGALRTQSCTVQLASSKHILGSATNVSAEIGSSVVLTCPFYSIPEATVTWQFANSTGVKFNNNRFYQLQNGSLLIVKVNIGDHQRYRCVATNNYMASMSQHIDLSVVPMTVAVSTLLPMLQNETVKVRTGDRLRLLCAGRFEMVRWSFTSRNGRRTNAIENTSYEFRKGNASRANDGFYNCSTSTDSQLFDVIILSAPVIEQQLMDKKLAIGSYEKLNCAATGNPEPIVTFYRNSKPIQFDYLVSHRDQVLTINSFEEDQKGYYQCIAKNEAGEAVSAAMMKWDNRVHANAMEDVKCYPINRSSLLVEFKLDYMPFNFLYYTADKETALKSHAVDDDVRRYGDRIVLTFKDRKPFTPFTLYIRALEKSSAMDAKIVYEMSRISKGVECALQGLQVSQLVHPTGIFIWWPTAYNLNVPYFLVEFNHDDKATQPIRFSDQIVGTTFPIRNSSLWADVRPHLVKITANPYPDNNDAPVLRRRRRRRHRRSIQPNSSRKFNQPQDDKVQMLVQTMDEKSNSAPRSKQPELSSVGNEAIAKLRVSGNVTGILIPNTRRIVVRVIVPIFDGTDELVQDYSFVEWKTIPSVVLSYKEHANSVRITVNNPNTTCLKVSYEFYDGHISCGKINRKNSVFVVDSLRSNTHYNFYVNDCETDSQIEAFNIHTSHDVPGAVIDPLHVRDDGIALKWLPPLSDNSTVIYNYLIEWTIDNKTHSANVTADTLYFEFPDTHRNDKFNISIRAIGNYGTGIPRYIDLKNLEYSDDSGRYETKPNHQTLGIAIGLMLSTLCIVLFMWLIIRLRNHSKNRAGLNGNALSPASVATTTSPPALRLAAPPVRYIDLHEMQTLINTTEPPYQSLQTAPNGSANTIVRQSSNHNGNMALPPPLLSSAKSVVNKDEAINIDPLFKYKFMFSSTPKKEQPTANELVFQYPAVVKVNSKHSTPTGLPLPPPPPNPSEIQSNANNTLTKGLTLHNRQLPQLMHSIDDNNDDDNEDDNDDEDHATEDEETTTSLPSTPTPPPPFIASEPTPPSPSLPVATLTTTITDKPQYLNDYHSNSLAFDSSQQQLLNSTVDSSKIAFDAFNDDSINVDDETIELNTGNGAHTGYSQKPLNSWNYRRPIVGPNG